MKSSQVNFFNSTSMVFLRPVLGLFFFTGLLLLSSIAEASSRQSKTNSLAKPTVACMGHSAERVAELEYSFHRQISKYAYQNGLNPNFIKAVISVESCFNHKAVSRAGAMGLMQLMPATAKWLGVTDAFDSSQNLEAGARYLKQLAKRFDNDYKLALAAYNAGPGNVRKYKGIPPFSETQRYVKKVMSRFHEYQAQNQLAMLAQ
ncbi:MAG: lytic transglycosylase domain-containing protein [Methyloligellaceae bacterium]